jgi:hypothetical protein
MTSNSRCENVICLLSKSWLESRECTVEFRTAEGFGKRILVARLENTGDSDITSHWQRCDLFAEGAQTAIEVPEGPPVRFTPGLWISSRRPWVSPDISYIIQCPGLPISPDSFAARVANERCRWIEVMLCVRTWAEIALRARNFSSG